MDREEAWAAEYRLKQDTAALTRSAGDKPEEEGSPKFGRCMAAATWKATWEKEEGGETLKRM